MGWLKITISTVERFKRCIKNEFVVTSQIEKSSEGTNVLPHVLLATRE